MAEYDPDKPNENPYLDDKIDNDDADDTNLPPPLQPDETQPSQPEATSTPYQPPEDIDKDIE